MKPNANQFVASRKVRLSITTRRINIIIDYIIFCYQKLKKDSIKFSKKEIKANSHEKLEDYLSAFLVDEYLVPLKRNHLKQSAIEDISFQYETQKRFKDAKGKVRRDRIDIFISRLGLKNVWSEDDEDNIYFAIECKIIEVGSDCAKYVGDIEKFCNRNYEKLRLPIEGMMAFVFKSDLTSQRLQENINNRLEKNSSIQTIEPLHYQSIRNNFHHSFSSSHIRNLIDKNQFTIYHLFFDYSEMIFD